MAQFNYASVNNIHLMELFQRNTYANINCHLIGKIKEFYPEKQTADIQIQHIEKYKDELFTPVILKDVPVFIYGTPTAYITMPNMVGTNCIVMVMDRNIDAFLQTGEMYQPTTSRLHNITDCIALCTFKTQVDTIQDYDNESIILSNSQIDEEENKTRTKVSINDKFLLLKNNKIDKDDNETYAQINISDKINLQNDKRNLATLIENLLIACENIVVNAQTGVITPTAKQAFTNLKTQFRELLQ